MSAGASAATLDDVKQRGVLHCGTAPNIPGFAFTDDQGDRRGFDIDLCRALAAAIFGDANKIKLTPLGPRDAFAALQTGVVDILTHRFTWTYVRDNGGGLEFTQALFFDGQGFMVKKSAQREERQRAQRRLDLPGPGHDDGAERRRLFPHAQHALLDRHLRRPRRGAPRL